VLSGIIAQEPFQTMPVGAEASVSGNQIVEDYQDGIVHSHIRRSLSPEEPQVRPFGLMTGVSEQRKQLSSAPFSIAPWRRSRKWGAAGCLSLRI
jgi:hypothetical protein